MTLKGTSFLFSILCLTVGLIATGCNETEPPKDSPAETNTELTSVSSPEGCSGCCSETATETETVICNKCGQEKTVSAKNAECSECPDGQCAEGAQTSATAKKAGCCGKCAAEPASNKSGEECNQCGEGDSANCKCESETADAKPSGQESPVESQDAASDQPTSDFALDREVFHFLLSNKDKITRTVTELSNGVETLTESSDPALVEKIQEHVAAMHQRLENDQPIRMRDPLYREVFKHTDKINMKLEKTAGGIRVTETSDDEYVAKVIQSHAKVVSGFVEHGFEEARKNHEPPQK